MSHFSFENVELVVLIHIQYIMECNIIRPTPLSPWQPQPKSHSECVAACLYRPNRKLNWPGSMHLALRLWNPSQTLRSADKLKRLFTSGTTTRLCQGLLAPLPISFIVLSKNVCAAGVCAFFRGTMLLLDTNVIVTVLWLLDALNPQETATNPPCMSFTCTRTHEPIAKSSQISEQ